VRENPIEWPFEPTGVGNMTDARRETERIPLMQRLYNRIWLLAAAAMLFFLVSYVGWGLIDVLSVTPR
jgi:hypothetical protein